MYYVYILLSDKDDMLYFGSTPNLQERIAKHDAGFVKATQNRRPLKLLYYEAYSSKIDALKREKYFKGGKGHNDLKVQFENTLLKNNYIFL
ncbi:MAG: GIY-YIG nuclease family protein [Patescibacteria group bacterium]|jgi:putative endonuclease